MATASIPAPSATRKRRPSPDLILRIYRQECITAGDRGAANRAAALLGISDDTVRRVVARDEAARKAREETPQELIFTPPDAAYEAERDMINRTHAAELAARLPPSVRQSYVKPERETGENAATMPQADAADHRTGERGTHDRDAHREPAPGQARPDVDEPGSEAPELPPEAWPNPQPNQPPDRQGDPYDGSRRDGEMEPKRSGIPRSPSGYDQLEERPAHETPEEHLQPTGIPRLPSGGELPEERPRRPEALIVRQIVRVPEPRQVGGLVGWLSTNPMLGPVPVWALLLLGFGALLVQLGVLG